MAGDWIKMRCNLWDDPRVTRLCDLTDTGEATVIGALYWLWSMADQHTEDGRLPGMTLRQIDRKTGVSGFGAALVDVGWLVADESGVEIQGFEDHNGASAKKRCQTAQRVASARSRNAQETQHEDACNAASVTDALAREEKRREEKEETKTTPARKRADAIPCPDGVTDQVWQDWLSLRKAKRAPVTATVIREAEGEARKAGMSFDAFLRVWCSRGSQGLQAEWLKPHERAGPSSMDKRAAEAAKWIGPSHPMPGFDFVDVEASDAAPLALR